MISCFTPPPFTGIYRARTMGCTHAPIEKEISKRFAKEQSICEPSIASTTPVAIHGAGNRVAHCFFIDITIENERKTSSRAEVETSKPVCCKNVGRLGRHPATISPTIFAINAFDRSTGRPHACASCRRCASMNPMQSSSSASAPRRASETPAAATVSIVSV